MNETQAIREYIVRKMSLWIDSEQWSREQVMAAVAEDISTDAGNGNGDREEYERGYQRDEYALCAGNAIAGWLENLAKDCSSGLAQSMLLDIVDLGDRDMLAMLGEGFLPDVDDIEWPESDDDQDEDCEHYGVECERPCSCTCEDCQGSDEDIAGSGED